MANHDYSRDYHYDHHTQDHYYPCEMVTRLHSMVYGNGNEGLLVRLARIEERIDSLKRDLEDFNADTMRRMEARLRWAIALIPSLIYLLFNLVMHYLDKN